MFTEVVICSKQEADLVIETDLTPKPIKVECDFWIQLLRPSSFPTLANGLTFLNLMCKMRSRIVPASSLTVKTI